MYTAPPTNVCIVLILLCLIVTFLFLFIFFSFFCERGCHDSKYQQTIFSTQQWKYETLAVLSTDSNQQLTPGPRLAMGQSFFKALSPNFLRLREVFFSLLLWMVSLYFPLSGKGGGDLFLKRLFRPPFV